MSLDSIGVPASYVAFHERAFLLDKLGIPENDFMDEVVDAVGAKFRCGSCGTGVVSVTGVSEAVGAHYDLSSDQRLLLEGDLENWAYEFSTDGGLCRAHAS